MARIKAVSLQGPPEEQNIPVLEQGVICSTGNNLVLWKPSISLHPPPDWGWAQLGRGTKAAHTDRLPPSWDSFWVIPWLFQPFYHENWNLSTIKERQASSKLNWTLQFFSMETFCMMEHSPRDQVPFQQLTEFNGTSTDSYFYGRHHCYLSEVNHIFEVLYRVWALGKLEMMPNLLKHLKIATFMVLPMVRKIACVGPVLRGGNLLKNTEGRYLNEKVECTFNDSQDIEGRISTTAYWYHPKP